MRGVRVIDGQNFLFHFLHFLFFIFTFTLNPDTPSMRRNFFHFFTFSLPVGSFGPNIFQTKTW